MTAITAVTASDVRFPTSLSMDGSDAMNKDGDYSAAYITLTTDDPALSGFGFTFTIGRGNDLCVEAARQRALPLIGRDVDELVGGSRCGLPRTAERHAAALARSGEGRRAPRARGGHERRLGSRRPPRRQAAVAAARRHDARAAGGCRRPALPLRRDHPRRGHRDAHRAGAHPGEADRGARGQRLPVLHDERGMAGLLRRQAAPALPGGGRLRIPAHQAQGRREHRRRHPAARHRARGHRLGRQPDDRRQPGLGRPRGDRMGEPARRVQAALDRGADQPRRRARPRGDP